MNKMLLALSAASLCALNVHAKQNAKEAIEKMNAPRTAGKTTGIESRLKSMSSFEYNAGVSNPTDSGFLNYQPNFGWDNVLQTWKFDTGIGYSFNGTNYDETYRAANTYDAQKRLLEELGEEYDGTNWAPTNKAVYTYNTFGTVATQEFQFYNNGSWTTSYKTTNTYDAQGRLIETVSQFDNGTGTLQNQSRTATTYNAQGKVETETNYYWNTGQWSEGQLTTYYYTGTQNTTLSHKNMNGGTWELSDSTINTFDSRGNITEMQYNGYMSGSLAFQGKTLNLYDADNNCVSSVDMEYDGSNFIPRSKNMTSYNSFNQPLTEVYQTWDDATSAFIFADGDGGDNYHYEQFSNSVKDAAVAVGTMRVHPMPASKTLNLNWNDAQTASVVLFDMTGKVAAQWNTPAAAQHTQKLDISNIPAGTYMLKVMGTKGVLSQQVNIVK